MILTSDFYLQKPIDVARGLVGAWLCSMVDGHVIRGRICEVELYLENDRACHAFGGKCTPRTETLFRAGGCAYVYLCYGLHNLFNVVIGPKGQAAAVLIRALELPGADGPAKLTKVLGITRANNTCDLMGAGPLWLEARDRRPKIITGSRIGIDYAGADAALPWRFGIKDSPFLSKLFIEKK